MNKVSYSKTALTYAEQLQQLKIRGLIIEDEPKALHLLEVISYYRLSGYWYPLLADKQIHQFKPNSTFEPPLPPDFIAWFVGYNKKNR